MSEVIRKIISAATGIPPSLSGNKVFWTSFDGHIAKWGREYLKCDVDPELVTRKMVNTAQIATLTGENISHLFSLEHSGMEGAIAISNDLAMRYSAGRINEPLEAFSQISELLIKLVSEEPAKALWSSITRTYSGDDAWANKLAISESPNLEQSLNAGTVYIELKYMFDLADSKLPIWVVLPQASLKLFARRLSGPSVEMDRASAPAAIRSSIRSSDVSLDAVLEQFQMTVAEAGRLREGQILPLSNAETSRLSLCVNTLEGPLEIAEGEMGVLKQGRAIKLSGPISPSFVRNIADL